MGAYGILLVGISIIVAIAVMFINMKIKSKKKTWRKIRAGLLWVSLVVIISGIALKMSADREAACEAELKSRFGTVSLSSEQAKEYADQIVNGVNE